MALKSDFPLGMRVLAIDDDPATLKSLENLLTRCQYNVEVTTQPTIAIRMLRRNRNRQFDMIIMDVHMPGIDGFKFIKLVDNEFHIPVIIVSEDGSRETIGKAVANGSCEYLLKPVRLSELSNIWTHILRRKLVSKGRLTDNLCILQDEQQQQQQQQQRLTDALDNKQHKHKHKHKHKHRLIPTTEHDGAMEAKRKRLMWTEELHHKFLAAVHSLGLDKAVPKKILELMKVDDLTLEHVSSHLQKYKLYVKKLSAVTGRHALIAAESLSRGESRTKLVLGRNSVHPKTHQNIEIAGNSQSDLLPGVPPSFELLGQLQQQQQQSMPLRLYYRSGQEQQQQPMAIQDANGNDNLPLENHLSIETAGTFQPNWLRGLPTPSNHPSDNNSLLDPTELFYDSIDFDTLDQLQQHDQTWQYGVPTTILSDLPSVLMTPLFGDSFDFDFDSDFSQLLQPIISDDNNSSSTPQAKFSNHLMQGPQQEWHQTYDQNSSPS